MRREITANGTEDDILCMQYVLDAEAGSSKKVWPNGGLKFDCDQKGDVYHARLAATQHGIYANTKQHGVTLRDFYNHPKARMAKLSEAQVAALRMYTTAMFVSINNPLRDSSRGERNEPHPLPLTVMHIAEGVKKLRAVGASGEQANTTIDLYRGMRNVELPPEFMEKGGTERAPMSTTTDPSIAVKYSASAQGIILKLTTRSSMERGADLTFLSCFPGEREFLFPPLTYLQPLKKDTIELNGSSFTIVSVEPKT